MGWLKVAPANQGKVTGDQTANQKTHGITGSWFFPFNVQWSISVKSIVKLSSWGSVNMPSPFIAIQLTLYISAELLSVKSIEQLKRCENVTSTNCYSCYFVDQYLIISNCNWDFRPSIVHANHKVQHEQCIGLMQSHHLWTMH